MFFLHKSFKYTKKFIEDNGNFGWLLLLLLKCQSITNWLKIEKSMICQCILSKESYSRFTIWNCFKITRKEPERQLHYGEIEDEGNEISNLISQVIKSPKFASMPMKYFDKNGVIRNNSSHLIKPSMTVFLMMFSGDYRRLSDAKWPEKLHNRKWLLHQVSCYFLASKNMKLLSFTNLLTVYLPCSVKWCSSWKGDISRRNTSGIPTIPDS